MEEQQQVSVQTHRPRRRRRTQAEIFKEAYLPAIIAGAAVLMIIIFVIGSITRSIQRKRVEEEIRANEITEEQQADLSKLTEEANALIAEADLLAADYRYDEAIAKLDTFSGDMSRFPTLTEKRTQLQEAKSKMVAWSDPSKITHLSFQMLIADPARAFKDASLGSKYNQNFVTTGEFSKILQQLYNNGYMLVSLDDFVSAEKNDAGATVYRAKTLYLPAGKKPLMITQNQVNYYKYMVDGDNDKLRQPDKDGAGFANKLVVGADGKVTCQYVDATGKSLTGAYDLVPILDKFIENNPSFSYRGAKAIISVSGYEGVFGYRTDTDSKSLLGATAYAAEVEGAKKVAKALRDSGYEIACYTYSNKAYGNATAAEIRADLSGWNSEVLPILGNVDILVYAQNSDITTNAVYTGEKFNILQNAGFRYYLGFAADGSCWATITDSYVRMGRIMVTGSNLAHHASWFNGIFNANAVLDTTRGNVPK